MKSFLFIVAGAALIFCTDHFSLVKPQSTYALYAGFFLIVTGLHLPLYRKKSEQIDPELREKMLDIKGSTKPKKFHSLLKVIAQICPVGFSDREIEKCLNHMKKMKIGDERNLEFNVNFKKKYVPLLIKMIRSDEQSFGFIITTIPPLASRISSVLKPAVSKQKKKAIA